MCGPAKATPAQGGTGTKSQWSGDSVSILAWHTLAMRPRAAASCLRVPCPTSVGRGWPRHHCLWGLQEQSSTHCTCTAVTVNVITISVPPRASAFPVGPGGSPAHAPLLFHADHALCETYRAAWLHRLLRLRALGLITSCSGRALGGIRSTRLGSVPPANVSSPIIFPNGGGARNPPCACPQGKPGPRKVPPVPVREGWRGRGVPPNACRVLSSGAWCRSCLLSWLCPDCVLSRADGFPSPVPSHWIASENNIYTHRAAERGGPGHKAPLSEGLQLPLSRPGGQLA